MSEVCATQIWNSHLSIKGLSQLTMQIPDQDELKKHCSTQNLQSVRCWYHRSTTAAPPQHHRSTTTARPHTSCDKPASICCFSSMKMVCCAWKLVTEGGAFSPSICSFSAANISLINDEAIRQKTDVQIQLSRDIRQLKHIKLSSLYSLTKCAVNSC